MVRGDLDRAAVAGVGEHRGTRGNWCRLSCPDVPKSVARERPFSQLARVEVVEALAAAHQLDAEIAVSGRDVGPNLQVQRRSIGRLWALGLPLRQVAREVRCTAPGVMQAGRGACPNPTAEQSPMRREP
jgi:hypothetical protein